MYTVKINVPSQDFLKIFDFKTQRECKKAANDYGTLAYSFDIFKNGKLIKSYSKDKYGVGNYKLIKH